MRKTLIVKTRAMNVDSSGKLQEFIPVSTLEIKCEHTGCDEAIGKEFIVKDKLMFLCKNHSNGYAEAKWNN